MIAGDHLLQLGSLLVLFVICFIANGIIPMPVTSYIFWLGQFDYPWVVVLVGTLGSVCGWPVTAKYLKLLLAKKPDLVDRIPDVYRRIFSRGLGVSVFVCNALPLPWDPTRMLAVAYGYPQKKLLLAIGTGRAVRNTLLVTLGAALAPYKFLFWGVLVGLMLLPLLANKVYLAVKPVFVEPSSDKA